MPLIAGHQVIHVSGCGAVPFTVAGTGIAPKGQASYDEIVAAASDLAFAKGHNLMKWFLG